MILSESWFIISFSPLFLILFHVFLSNINPEQILNKLLIPFINIIININDEINILINKWIIPNLSIIRYYLKKLFTKTIKKYNIIYKDLRYIKFKKKNLESWIKIELMLLFYEYFLINKY